MSDFGRALKLDACSAANRAESGTLALCRAVGRKLISVGAELMQCQDLGF